MAEGGAVRPVWIWGGGGPAGLCPRWKKRTKPGPGTKTRLCLSVPCAWCGRGGGGARRASEGTRPRPNPPPGTCRALWNGQGGAPPFVLLWDRRVPLSLPLRRPFIASKTKTLGQKKPKPLPCPPPSPAGFGTPTSGCSEELQVLRLQLMVDGEPGFAKRQLRTPKKSCPQVLPCSLGQAEGTACGWVTRDSPRSIPAGRGGAGQGAEGDGWGRSATRCPQLERDRLRPPDTPPQVFTHLGGVLGAQHRPDPLPAPLQRPQDPGGAPRAPRAKRVGSSQPPSPPQSTQEADDTDIEIFLLPDRQKNKIKFQSRFHNLGGRLQQRHRPLQGLRARPPPPQNIQIKPDAKNKYRFSGGERVA